ncbi:hypothetical protein KEC55_10745 [Burkholderia cepacia]|uniref:hypothetical protein n=1 Tax=Burkholderia cepacia TaxID=292 RepID=UPI00249DA912|nr:hypothetical protein [Burkholderia cepacia]WGY67333.1 hypothetical protein KEC55_10745 [Burkholderia cepacia]
MLARLRALVGGRKPTAAPAVIATDALPPEVQVALAGATIADRGEDDEGNRHILVILAGGGAFRYSRESASAWLRSQYSLNDAQVSRALKMLHALVIEAQRGVRAAPAQRSDWASWKPLEL